MKAVELAASLKGCWRKIPITLIGPRQATSRIDEGR